MLKKILALLAMLYAVASFAAVDVNKATAAELDALKGIGPGISGKIVEERKKGDFKNWQDFIDRVKGVGEKNAAKFSAEGMTVNGASFTGAPAAADAKKPATKAEKPAATTAAAASAPKAAEKPAAAASATDAKAEAKAKKEAEKKAKAEEKAKKAEEAKAKKEEAKAKKAAAKEAKPAASAASAKK